MSGVGSGTQSPPLEATGEAVPMGVSSINQEEPTKHVKDADQRKEYFDNSDKSGQQTASEKEKKGKERKEKK